jgi:hypothetical protein
MMVLWGTGVNHLKRKITRIDAKIRGIADDICKF